MICSRCNAPTAPLDLCPTSHGNACRACFDLCGVEEAARKLALSRALGCAPDEIDAHKLAAFGLLLHEATPAAIAAPEAKAAKAAHDESLALDLDPAKAREVAAAVRREPGKATLIVADAVSKSVDDALAKAAK